MTDVKILVFVCNWCSYGGADHAGGLKLVYPAGVRLVRVMCSGRVDAQLVLHGFRSGADGVLILGCHPGDCHYKTGNVQTRSRAAMLQPLLLQFGIAAERFAIDWVSSKEGPKFAQVVTQMYETVAKLGPLPRTLAAVPEVQP